MKLRILFLILTTCFSNIGFTQNKGKDFYEQIKDYDLSVVLTADSFLPETEENEDRRIIRPPILGFIGDDYQRFFIHFISVIQHPTNPYEYFVYGKTKVKNNICTFQGTIVIREAYLYEDGEYPEYMQGYAVCELSLFEDKKENSSGFIKGHLTSYFLIDNKGVFRYDALMFVADGFSNNQFVGTWTNYKTNYLKKCHWGDYRIPDCGDLDIGAGEFFVNDKYINRGWENYVIAYQSYPKTEEAQKATAIEEEEWWKE